MGWTGTFRLRAAVPTMALCLVILGLSAPSVAQEAPSRRPSQRILLKLRSDAAPALRQSILKRVPGEILAEIPGIEVKLIKLNRGVNPQDELDALNATPGVEFAEFDNAMPVQMPLSDAAAPSPESSRSNAPAMALAEGAEALSYVPNDPYYGEQWWLSKISAPTAWNSTQGSSSVIIAVIDSGIDTTHPDLAGKLVSGYDMYRSITPLDDLAWTGTWKAGIAAAATNNGAGIAGVCPNCKVMPVRYFDDPDFLYDNWQSPYAMSRAIIWAVDHGAKVVLVQGSVFDESQSLQYAGWYVMNKGALLIASGVESTTMPARAWPLRVSALDDLDQPVSGFATGPSIDLSAPGWGIRSLYPGGGYVYSSGTGPASALVAGVAGLVFSAKPTLTGKQVRDILFQTATDLGDAGRDSTFGWGRVNAAAAVQMALGMGPNPPADTQAPTITFVQSPSGTGVPTVILRLADNVGVAHAVVHVDNVAVDGLDGAFDAYPYTADEQSFNWATWFYPNGLHTFRVDAYDAAMNMKSSNTVSVNVSNTVDTTAPFSANFQRDNSYQGQHQRLQGYEPFRGSGDDHVTSMRILLDGSSIPAFFKPNGEGLIICLNSSNCNWGGAFYYVWDTKSMANGSHTFQAVSKDYSGNETLGYVQTFNIMNDASPPAVSLTSPANNAVVSGKITISAMATDPAYVKKVRFYKDLDLTPFAVTQYLTNDVASFTYDTAALPDGQHTLYARAYDNSGNFSTTSTITITVRNSSALVIIASSPPDGYVDPLEDRDASTPTTLYGPKDISITFSEPVTTTGGAALSAANFLAAYYRGGLPVTAATADLATQAPPTVSLVSGSGAGPYTLRFSPRIPLGAWTQITVVNAVNAAGSSISAINEANKRVFGFLPMDTTQDGRVLGDDINRWVAISRNNYDPTPLTMADLCDQKRNGSIAGEDISRSIQLITGAPGSTFRAWSNFDIGAKP